MRYPPDTADVCFIIGPVALYATAADESELRRAVADILRYLDVAIPQLHLRAIKNECPAVWPMPGQDNVSGRGPR